MKKSKIIIGFLIIIGLFLISVKIINYQRMQRISNVPIDQLPPLVMINNNVYQGFGIDEDFKNGNVSSTGTIKEIIDNNIPTENEQANFGKVGMEYWLTDDKQYPLKVKLDDKILKFEYIEIDEEGTLNILINV